MPSDKDSSATNVTAASTVVFDAYFLNGLFVFSGQRHGQLTVSSSSLIMIDDSKNEIFSLPKQDISNVRDDLSGITIFANGKKYRLAFRNPWKGAAKELALGPVFGTGGKNGVFAAGPQEYGKQVVESLIQHGYPTVLNKHRPQ